jgi:hypothetical protein
MDSKSEPMPIMLPPTSYLASNVVQMFSATVMMESERLGGGKSGRSEENDARDEL